MVVLGVSMPDAQSGKIDKVLQLSVSQVKVKVCFVARVIPQYCVFSGHHSRVSSVSCNVWCGVTQRRKSLEELFCNKLWWLGSLTSGHDSAAVVSRLP